MCRGLNIMSMTERYTGVAMALHWLIAALILGQIAFGWYLQSVPRKTPERTVYVNLHKSTGLTLGLYRPFAAVSTARLRLEAVHIDSDEDPADWVALNSAGHADATGDIAGDFFGVDIGL